MKKLIINFIFTLPFGYFFIIKKLSFFMGSLRNYHLTLKSFKYFMVHADLSINSFAPLLKYNCFPHQLAEDLIVISFLKKGDQAIDIGANIGFNTAIFSDLVGEKGRVYSFEPSKVTFKFIDELSKKYPQINIFQLAAGDRTCKLNFIDEDHSDLSHINEIPGNKRGYSIDCVRLDDWMDGIDCFNPKFLKIDAEGFDLQVIRGASRLISQYRPIICFECSDTDILNLTKIIINKDLTYKFYRVKCKYPTSIFHKEDWTNNYFAIPQDKSKDVPDFIFDRGFLNVIN
jgi:FkbM family methyltransferase